IMHVEPRDDTDLRPCSKGRESRTIEGVGVDEARDVTELLLRDQRLAVAYIARDVIAQHDRFGARDAAGNGIEHVAAASGRDVDDVRRLITRTQAPHRVAQQLFDVPLSLPDAAPADRLEIDPVDETADR